MARLPGEGELCGLCCSRAVTGEGPREGPGCGLTSRFPWEKKSRPSDTAAAQLPGGHSHLGPASGIMVITSGCQEQDGDTVPTRGHYSLELN